MRFVRLPSLIYGDADGHVVLVFTMQAMSVTPLSGDDLEMQMRKRLNENKIMFHTMAAARAGA